MLDFSILSICLFQRPLSDKVSVSCPSHYFSCLEAFLDRVQRLRFEYIWVWGVWTLDRVWVANQQRDQVMAPLSTTGAFLEVESNDRHKYAALDTKGRAKNE